MTKLRLILWGLAVIVCMPVTFGQVVLTKGNSKANEFGMINRKSNAHLYFDEQDFEVVKKAANLFSDDVQLVTGKKMQVEATKNKLASNSIIVGTLGHNKLIDKLVAKNKLDVRALENR